MIRLGKPLAAASLLAAFAVAAPAGTELVAFPEGYATTFLRYQVVDRADRKIARFMYINQPAWDAAAAGQPLPDGSIVLMEDHKVRMKDEETPVTDAEGRFIPTDETTNLFVMEKRAGWGAEYPEELRNGEWEYAWFTTEGVRSDRALTGCFECHKGQEAEDFTFTTFKAIAARK